jgi:hypothetical protein
MTRTHPSGPPAVGSWIPLIALELVPNLAAGDIPRVVAVVFAEKYSREDLGR